ncbi:MAG: GHKL domain-containing protein [Oscillospiraceae bacterium]|nr:GHKL domain-containing protein [Oscillospiraceae bacterium]
MSYFVYIMTGAGTVAAGFVIFILLRKYITALADKRIASYQSDLIIKHYDEVQNIYSQMRGWRHDYHNHIQAMKAFLTAGNTDEHLEYLGKLDADLTSVDTVIKTGNVMVDAILNSKLSLASSKKIKIITKVAVPQKLKVSEIDLCVIIGNLLDNAIEACMKLPDKNNRFIRVFFGTHKSMLYIGVFNTAGDEIKKIGKTYISTKELPFHGLGLMRIDRIAAKYGGFVNRQNEKGVFATEIMLPL